MVAERVCAILRRIDAMSPGEILRSNWDPLDVVKGVYIYAVRQNWHKEWTKRRLAVITLRYGYSKDSEQIAETLVQQNLASGMLSRQRISKLKKEVDIRLQEHLSEDEWKMFKDLSKKASDIERGKFIHRTATSRNDVPVDQTVAA